MFNDDEKQEVQMQTLGEDYDNVYGYAQEHHTVELYMRLWKRHNRDVIRRGTPPTIKKLYSLPVLLGISVWGILIL